MLIPNSDISLEIFKNPDGNKTSEMEITEKNGKKFCDTFYKKFKKGNAKIILVENKIRPNKKRKGYIVECRIIFQIVGAELRPISFYIDDEELELIRQIQKFEIKKTKKGLMISEK